MFLLVFGLGGLGMPLAHHIDHLIDAAGHESTDEYAYTTPEEAKLHDCSLCEVRVTAAAPELPAASPPAYPASHTATPPEVVVAAQGRLFDSRGPPARI